MTWQLTWGPHVKALSKLARQGFPTPALDARPQVREDLAWVLEGFWVLNRTRSSHGFGINPIPLGEVKTYLDLIGCTRTEQRLQFLELVLVLDEVMMRWSLDRGRDTRSDADTEG